MFLKQSRISSMKKQTEIEIRGALDKGQFEKLKSLLLEKGSEIKHYRRLSVDISPGFDSESRTWKMDDTIDLRIKKSDESEKITLKIGQYAGKERHEIELNLYEGELAKAAELFDLLDFNKGMIYYWESWEYAYQKYEVKLTKMADDYFEWEIESKDKKFDPHVLAAELGLTPFTESEFKKRIDWQNQNIHRLYSQPALKKLIKTFKANSK